MNAGGAVEPIVSIDEESGANVECQWRVTKVRFQIHLLWQIRSGVKPPNYLPGIHAGTGIYFGERLSRNAREPLLVVILIAPTTLHQVAKLFEGLHALVF